MLCGVSPWQGCCRFAIVWRWGVVWILFDSCSMSACACMRTRVCTYDRVLCVFWVHAVHDTV